MKKLKVMFGMGFLIILMVNCQKELLPEPELNKQIIKADSSKTLVISRDTTKQTIIVSTDPIENLTKAGSISVDYLKTFSPKAGDSDYFILKSNTSWKIASYPSWVTVSPLSGTGNAHVTVTVKENTGAQRSDVISISGTGVLKNATINVLQLAGSTPASTLSVDWLKTFSSIAGDNDYFIITSNTSWKITTFPNWVSVSPLSGTGTGHVTVTVLANTGIQRSGSITVTGTGVQQVASINVLQVAGTAPITVTPVQPVGNETIYNYPFAVLGSTIINKNLVANSGVTGILLDYQNTSVDVENNYIESNNAGIAATLFVHDATSAKAVKIDNNVIQFSNPTNYTILVGSETSGSSDNYYNGTEIIGNRITGIGSFNTGSVSNHGIFVGFSKDATIKYNFCSNVPYSSAVKSKTLDNTNGIISYNLYKNSKYAVTCKGIANTKIYNNTFFSDNTSIFNYATFITLTKNEDGGNGSTGTLIKNNIFYSSGLQTMMISINDPESLVGLQCDYNVYYRAGSDHSLVFRYNDGTTTQYLTFAQWQALGFDKHSVVLDPGLDPTTLIPSSPVQNGVNLGTSYSAGLDISNAWNRGNIITKSQGAVWQNGAFIK